MSADAPKDDLALERVMPHHRAAWRAERIAWAAGAVALLAGVLGLFGYGVLSDTTVGTRGALQIRYDRLQRSSAPSEYEVTIGAGLASAGALRLRFDQGLVDAMEIADWPLLNALLNTASGATQPARIMFRFRPTTFGHVSGRVAAAGAPPVLLDQFIYP